MNTALFGVVVAMIVGSAIFVVRSNNLVRAVLWLGVSLAGTAILYAMLDAPFLAGVQVLTYIGGVVTLMIFGVMVTRRHTGEIIDAGSVGNLRAILVAGGFFGVMAWALTRTPLPVNEPLPPVAVSSLARALVDDYLFAFEVASLLLLAGMIGAVVLARRKDPARVGERGPILSAERASLVEGAAAESIELPAATLPAAAVPEVRP